MGEPILKESATGTWDVLLGMQRILRKAPSHFLGVAQAPVGFRGEVYSEIRDLTGEDCVERVYEAVCQGGYAEIRLLWTEAFEEGTIPSGV